MYCICLFMVIVIIYVVLHGCVFNTKLFIDIVVKFYYSKLSKIPILLMSRNFQYDRHLILLDK